MVTVMISVGLAEESLTSGDFSYRIMDDDTVEITGYTGKERKIDIPGEIDGKKVTSIGEKAFYESKARAITIPDGVTTINAEAFYLCEQLEEINIPQSVIRIEKEAFSDCFALESITLPDNLEYIGVRAFNWCQSLEEIIIPDSVKTIGEEAFNACFLLQNIHILKG